MNLVVAVEPVELWRKLPTPCCGVRWLAVRAVDIMSRTCECTGIELESSQSRCLVLMLIDGENRVRPCRHVDKAGEWRSCGKGLELRAKLSHALRERGFFTEHAGYAVQAMDDCGVISPAEGCSDLHQLEAEQLAHEIHGDLARGRERLCPGLGAEALWA